MRDGDESAFMLRRYYAVTRCRYVAESATRYDMLFSLLFCRYGATRHYAFDAR